MSDFQGKYTELPLPYADGTGTLSDTIFTVGLLERWPQPKEPEHGMVFALSGAKKSDGQSKRLAMASKVVIAPPALPE